MLQAQNEATKLEILREREVIQREREENKIIMIDLDSIKNPNECEFFRRKKIQILEKKTLTIPKYKVDHFRVDMEVIWMVFQNINVSRHYHMLCCYYYYYYFSILILMFLCYFNF